MTPNNNQNDQQPSKKKWFTFSNVSTAVLMLFALTMIFSPEVKGRVIQGLMSIGLFQPDIPKTEAGVNADEPSADEPVEEALFQDGTGNIVKLTEQKGKVVFINFWATWCPPCIAEMPSIEKLYSRYKDNKDVVFLMVDVDANYQGASAFMSKGGYTLPVYTPAGEMPRKYFAGSMPTTVILDKTGKIAFNHVGGADYSNPEVFAFIDKLLK